jgi:hypothetical protein
MNRYCRAAPVALASLFLAVPRSWTQPVTSPEILSAVVTTATNQLSIEGRGFSPHGTPPSVALAGTNLATVSYTDQTAVVSLPPALAAGSYSLRLKNGEGHIGVFTAIIGAGGAAILSGTCASLLGEGQSGASQGAIGLAGINTYCFSGTTQPIDPDAPGNALPIPSAGTLNNFTLVGYFTDLGVQRHGDEFGLYGHDACGIIGRTVHVRRSGRYGGGKRGRQGVGDRDTVELDHTRVGFDRIA